MSKNQVLHGLHCNYATCTVNKLTLMGIATAIFHGTTHSYASEEEQMK